MTTPTPAPAPMTAGKLKSLRETTEGNIRSRALRGLAPGSYATDIALLDHIDALTARVSRLLEAVEGAEKAIEPFRGAYDVKPPTADKWPDDKPLHECLPGIWPTWGDLKRLRESLATLRAAREGAR